MIVNQDEIMIISSLGWVDNAKLWLLDTRSDEIKKLELSDATGKQPLDVCSLSNGTVYARDRKTGSLLKGKLKRKWFA